MCFCLVGKGKFVLLLIQLLKYCVFTCCFKIVEGTEDVNRAYGAFMNVNHCNVTLLNSGHTGTKPNLNEKIERATVFTNVFMLVELFESSISHP